MKELSFYNQVSFTLCSFNVVTDFDLEKERSGLDEQGLKIAENQEISQKNRRKLAESTRGILHVFPAA